MIYFAQRANGDIKIGCSAHIANRLFEVERRHGKLTILGVMNGGFNLEKVLHKHFNEYRVEPHLTNSEWFFDCDDLRNYIARYTRQAEIKTTSDGPEWVTVALKPLTKRHLEALQNILHKRTGKRPTNSQTIAYLLQRQQDAA